MKEPNLYLSLLADLEGEFTLFQKTAMRILKARNRVEQERTDGLLVSGFAYEIHNLYNGLEAYFLRVSKFFENGLPSHDWHKVLVDKMCWQVESLRPALLTQEDRLVYQELRSFRHLFRHLYDRELDVDRVLGVFPSVLSVLEGFPLRHKEFCDALRRMAGIV